MASTSLRTDPCAYEEKLRRSMGPGMYRLTEPSADCDGCGRDIPADPFIRWQQWGPGFCAPGSTTDVSSELSGRNYKNTACAGRMYTPGSYTPPKGGSCAARGRQDPRACMAPTEPTRYSNPPCTLKETGYNRWEWLCFNPQDKAIMPFEHQVSYRIIAKDNHAPCIPTPQEMTNRVPGANTGRVDLASQWRMPDHVMPKEAALAVNASLQTCQSMHEAFIAPPGRQMGQRI